MISYSLFFLPEERRTRIERWLRGHEDARKLALADSVIISFGKSGRTWLRVMLSRVFQVRHGLGQRHLIAYDNLHRRVPAIPLIFFTHDNYLKDYTGQPGTKQPYYGKKVVLMVRDPADVAVSQYHQWKYRMADRKKTINDYPPAGADVALYDAVVRPAEDHRLDERLGAGNGQVPRPAGDPLRGPARRPQGHAAARPRVHRHAGDREGAAGGGGVRPRSTTCGRWSRSASSG
ncbi:MAG: sulfotransferase domain-containing protein [Rhodospirillales bacterium]